MGADTHDPYSRWTILSIYFDKEIVHLEDDAVKLELLAEWFDKKYPDQNDDVQKDLRRIAKKLIEKSLRERYEDIKRNQEASPDGGDGML